MFGTLPSCKPSAPRLPCIIPFGQCVCAKAHVTSAATRLFTILQPDPSVAESNDVLSLLGATQARAVAVCLQSIKSVPASPANSPRPLFQQGAHASNPTPGCALLWKPRRRCRVYP
eukprot:350572-Chlamydomonas_euryale.AAC.6